jgi:hypothetical protein
MTTIAYLKNRFPRTGTRLAVTGRIPMEFFEANEAEIRAVMRAECFRLFYRGPRISNRGRSRSRTRRCDATHVVISR